ncbi:hypothetical protein JCM8097_000690 [Rhodosporidiobolus ruineniae]
MGSFASSLASSAASIVPTPSPARTGPFTPTYADVHAALDALVAARLPPELAVLVLDLAEYYPTLVASSSHPVAVRAPFSGERQAHTLVVSDPIPAFPGAPEHPVACVRVVTDSRDQGFSNFIEHHGTRKGSSSWFELLLLRPRPLGASPPSSSSANDPPNPFTPLLPVRLHSNLHAVPLFTQYEAVLPPPPRPPAEPPQGPSQLEAADEDEDDQPEGEPDRTAALQLVQQAQAGDRIAVVALAEYPAWVNYVRSCELRVELRAV